MRRISCTSLRSLARSRGIMLLELLVAFAILSVSLAVLLQSAGASISRQRSVNNQMKAVSHAANVLAGLDLKNIEGQQITGSINEFYSWQASFEPEARFSASEDDARQPLELLAISVQIAWQEGKHSKTYRLNTKRLVKRTR